MLMNMNMNSCEQIYKLLFCTLFFKKIKSKLKKIN